MATGFGSVAFSVTTSDGELPAIASDETGLQTYEATVKVGSSANVDTLRSLQSIYTVRPMLGGINQGTIVVEAGVGVRSLTIPEANGAERVFDALLTSISASVYMTSDAAWMVDCSWLVLTETTP